MTHASILETIGHALYGTPWIAAFGRRFGISASTVRRWLAGKEDVPDGFCRDIFAWLEATIAELTRARDALVRAMQNETPKA